MKLNANDVRAICMHRSCGETMQNISDRFGVSKQLVSGICKGDFWKHETEGIRPQNRENPAPEQPTPKPSAEDISSAKAAFSHASNRIEAIDALARLRDMWLIHQGQQIRLITSVPSEALLIAVYLSDGHEANYLDLGYIMIGFRGNKATSHIRESLKVNSYLSRGVHYKRISKAQWQLTEAGIRKAQKLLEE